MIAFSGQAATQRPQPVQFSGDMENLLFSARSIAPKEQDGTHAPQPMQRSSMARLRFDGTTLHDTANAAEDKARRRTNSERFMPFPDHAKRFHPLQSPPQLSEVELKQFLCQDSKSHAECSITIVDKAFHYVLAKSKTI
ncbi:MAG: hypothetical protein MUF02_00795 [Acidobacteria bacterium]|nr:hypothetical protein [Acidobacteriota bacterium]